MGKQPITQLPQPATPLEAEIVAHIGRLMTQWANLESWFIKLLAVLLRCDSHRAELVFYTITTAVTRRTLLSRLLMVYVTDEQLRDKFTNLLDRFKSVTETRNKFAHAQYRFREDQYMMTSRFGADFDGSAWSTRYDFDKNLLNELKQGILNCLNLTDELVDFVKELAPNVLEKPAKPLHKHADTP
jgi:hypothetical protein